MNLSIALRTVLAVVLFSLIAVAADNSAPAYQKGTLAKDFTSTHKSYDLKDGDKGYQISNCADFQDGQVVDYRVKDGKLYIHRDDGKEYKCVIEATLGKMAPDVPPAPIYMKGTILGYSVRRDVHVSGGGGNPGGMVFPIGSNTRKAKVYELQGPELIYAVDYCGAFQAGQFAPGQVVEFRVDNSVSRLYIRHDGDKEYGCQLEGTRKPDVQTAAGAQPATGSAAPAAPSTAKLSVASVPDGADIEVDGNFSGNTPSDLEVPEGERTITVKKSGYKDWQRKMKVVAGSSIHLNAEMEKGVTP